MPHRSSENTAERKSWCECLQTHWRCHISVHVYCLYSRKHILPVRRIAWRGLCYGKATCLSVRPSVTRRYFV